MIGLNVLICVLASVAGRCAFLAAALELRLDFVAVAHVGFPLAYELFGEVIQSLEVIRCVSDVVRRKPKPPNGFLDCVKVLLFLSVGVRIIKPDMIVSMRVAWEERGDWYLRIYNSCQYQVTGCRQILELWRRDLPFSRHGT